MSISLTMITKNEEKNLSLCLKSAETMMDDIVIVDTGSTDNTKQIAQSLGAKVYDYKWNNDFAAARNFALSKSNSDWNLILDADEYITKWDQEAVEEFLQQGPAIGRINIISNYLQDGEEKFSQSYISRLIPKGVYFKGRIHEQIDSDLPRVDLPIEVRHTGYFNTDKSERNIHLLLAELGEQPDNPYVLYQLGRQYKLLKNYEKAQEFFEKSYFLASDQANYKGDLVVSLLYTIIETKDFERGLQLIQETESLLQELPDFYFGCGIFYMKLMLSNVQAFHSFLAVIEHSYLTCLELGRKNKREIVIGTGTFLAAYNLGVYYETLGMKEKAVYYYQHSAEYGYEKAIKRLELLN